MYWKVEENKSVTRCERETRETKKKGQTSKGGAEMEVFNRT